MKAAAAAAAAAGGGEGGRGGALAVLGAKRKKGAAGSGGGGVLWSPRGDGPSHGPVHSFGTRSTGVVRWGSSCGVASAIVSIVVGDVWCFVFLGSVFVLLHYVAVEEFL